MANSNPSRQTRFQQGSSGNPTGSSQRARTSAFVSKLPASTVAAVGAALLQGSLTDLAERERDPEASVIEHWMVKLIGHGIASQDAQIFKTIMDRVVGKTREEKEVAGGPVTEPGYPPLSTMSEQDIVAELERLRAHRLELGLG